MNIDLSKPMTKVFVWLLAELYLNYLGLDNLADFGEYVFDCRAKVYLSRNYGSDR